jgi:predicted RNA-binding Zn ribbon-like protein
MTSMTITAQHAEAPVVGDHLAMDLLNTEARADGATHDYWGSGADVMRWLARHGVAPGNGDGALDAGALLAQARTLRALARELVAQHKAGGVGDIGALDAYLHAYVSAPHLAHDGAGGLTLTRVVLADPVATLLGPVAEAVAQLLVEVDVNLMRQCEHPDCILWFVDRTKAHKRRWCSMALCGNRYKAAQFRKKAAAPSE